MCRILVINDAAPEVFLIRLLQSKLFCEQNAPSLPSCGFLSAVSKIPPHAAVTKARSHHIPCREKKRHAVASLETCAAFLVDQNAHCNATQRNAKCSHHLAWLAAARYHLRYSCFFPHGGSKALPNHQFLKDMQEQVTFHPSTLF